MATPPLHFRDGTIIRDRDAAVSLYFGAQYPCSTTVSEEGAFSFLLYYLSNVTASNIAQSLQGNNSVTCTLGGMGGETLWLLWEP